jgi:Chalcone isomerase-like
MRKKRSMTRATLGALLLALVPVTVARAGTLAGVTFPDTVTVDGATLVLNGLGLREATRLRVRAYVGGLYLKERTSDARTVIDSHQLKQVRLEFLRNIDHRNLASGWADALRRIGGKAMEPSIRHFTSLIGDVRRGDTMSFTWRPGTGIEVTLRGEVRGSVPGDQFARTLFEVWFGPTPGDERLKRGMLGK